MPGSAVPLFLNDPKPIFASNAIPGEASSNPVTAPPSEKS